MSTPVRHNPGRNRATVVALLGMIGIMGTLTYYAVPLYRLFCQVTGYGGTTQVAKNAPARVGNRILTIRFDANVTGKLPWSFQPAQREIKVRVGESKLAFFTAHNRASHAVTGNATFNVTPQKVGQYFVKVACFCFDEQTLKPGQRVSMPVSFYVDPGIVKDRNMNEVQVITLSYTFFRTRKSARAEPRR